MKRCWFEENALVIVGSKIPVDFYEFRNNYCVVQTTLQYEQTHLTLKHKFTRDHEILLVRSPMLMSIWVDRMYSESD